MAAAAVSAASFPRRQALSESAVWPMLVSHSSLCKLLYREMYRMNIGWCNWYKFNNNRLRGTWFHAEPDRNLIYIYIYLSYIYTSLEDIRKRDTLFVSA